MESLTPTLLRATSLLRLGSFLSSPTSTAPPCRNKWCSDESISSSSAENSTVLRVKEAPRYPRWEVDSDYCKWKDKEAEILSDVEPVVLLAKQILHSDKCMDGEQLSGEDEKIVVQRLLAYHPHAHDKIGCGIDSIMVDQHPQFKQSRCLFVIRTNGSWIDFSYQKCLRAYIRDKYPTHAHRFIREHFNHGTGQWILAPGECNFALAIRFILYDT